MKRPKQHVIDERAQRLLRDLVPPEWIVRDLPEDYGVDLEIEIVDQDFVSGNRIWVQLKGIDASPPRRAIDERHPMQPDRQVAQQYISYPASTKLLDYALRCGFPLLLFLADLEAEDVLWLPLRDEIETNLDRRNSTWRGQDTARVHIPSENSLRMEAARGWPGLRHYALEPVRLGAFGLMHAIHHELRYEADLSYFEYADGVYAVDEQDRLLKALDAAELGLTRVLALDAVFGSGGPGVRIVADQLRQAIELCGELRVRVPATSIPVMEAAIKVAQIAHAIDLVSTTIAIYHQMRHGWITYETAVSRSVGVLRR